MGDRPHLIDAMEKKDGSIYRWCKQCGKDGDALNTPCQYTAGPSLETGEAVATTEVVTKQLMVYADREAPANGKQKHISKPKVWKMANLLRLRGDITREKKMGEGGACTLRVQGSARFVDGFIKACTKVSHTHGTML